MDCRDLYGHLSRETRVSPLGREVITKLPLLSSVLYGSVALTHSLPCSDTVLYVGM